MTEELNNIKREHETQLNEEEDKIGKTMLKLTAKEGDINLNSLKLEYLLNNQRKMMMQKKFLEDQIDKDIKVLG